MSTSRPAATSRAPAPRRRRRPSSDRPRPARWRSARRCRGSSSASPSPPATHVSAGQLVAVVEAMKMEHEVRAAAPGRVHEVLVEPGAGVHGGQALLFLDPSGDAGGGEAVSEDADLDAVREDLAEVLHRHALTLDAARPDAVARRRAASQRTARENVADLVDPGTFVEYGPLAVAAQRRRRTLEELIAKSPGRRHGHRRRERERRRSSATRRHAARCWRTTSPSSPGPRACATTPRPTASSRWRSRAGCRSSCSAKAAGVARARTAATTATPSPSSPS